MQALSAAARALFSAALYVIIRAQSKRPALCKYTGSGDQKKREAQSTELCLAAAATISFVAVKSVRESESESGVDAKNEGEIGKKRRANSARTRGEKRRNARSRGVSLRRSERRLNVNTIKRESDSSLRPLCCVYI